MFRGGTKKIWKMEIEVWIRWKWRECVVNAVE